MSKFICPGQAGPGQFLGLTLCTEAEICLVTISACIKAPSQDCTLCQKLSLTTCSMCAANPIILVSLVVLAVF